MHTTSNTIANRSCSKGDDLVCCNITKGIFTPFKVDIMIGVCFEVCAHKYVVKRILGWTGGAAEIGSYSIPL
ncbi:hypothetical protein RW26_02420 [Aeromonas sp. L_1B5_3]|nr:hypothetical protein RW26_02420 [Aeromonas sp. L_1B5_3]